MDELLRLYDDIICCPCMNIKVVLSERLVDSSYVDPTFISNSFKYSVFLSNEASKSKKTIVCSKKGTRTFASQDILTRSYILSDTNDIKWSISSCNNCLCDVVAESSHSLVISPFLNNFNIDYIKSNLSNNAYSPTFNLLVLLKDQDRGKMTSPILNSIATSPVLIDQANQAIERMRIELEHKIQQFTQEQVVIFQQFKTNMYDHLGALIVKTQAKLPPFNLNSTNHQNKPLFDHNDRTFDREGESSSADSMFNEFKKHKSHDGDNQRDQNAPNTFGRNTVRPRRRDRLSYVVSDDGKGFYDSSECDDDLLNGGVHVEEISHSISINQPQINGYGINNPASAASGINLNLLSASAPNEQLQLLQVGQFNNTGVVNNAKYTKPSISLSGSMNMAKMMGSGGMGILSSSFNSMNSDIFSQHQDTSNSNSEQNDDILVEPLNNLNNLNLSPSHDEETDAKNDRFNNIFGLQKSLRFHDDDDDDENVFWFNHDIVSRVDKSPSLISDDDDEDYYEDEDEDDIFEIPSENPITQNSNVPNRNQPGTTSNTGGTLAMAMSVPVPMIIPSKTPVKTQEKSNTSQNQLPDPNAVVDMTKSVNEALRSSVGIVGSLHDEPVVVSDHALSKIEKLNPPSLNSKTNKTNTNMNNLNILEMFGQDGMSDEDEDEDTFQDLDQLPDFDKLDNSKQTSYYQSGNLIYGKKIGLAGSYHDYAHYIEKPNFRQQNDQDQSRLTSNTNLHIQEEDVIVKDTPVVGSLAQQLSILGNISMNKPR